MAADKASQAILHPLDDEPEDLVTAEVIAVPSQPLRFGLTGLLILITICAAQFALMNYLGPYVGVATGLAVGMALLGGLLVVAILFGRHRNAALWQRLDTLAIRTTLAICLLGLGTLFAGGGYFAYVLISETYTQYRMQQQIGIRVQTIEVLENNELRPCLHVTTVVPGSNSDFAGFQEDDVIVLQGTRAEFFAMLQENRGKSVNVTVAPDARNQSLDTCPQIVRELVVP